MLVNLEKSSQDTIKSMLKDLNIVPLADNLYYEDENKNKIYYKEITNHKQQDDLITDLKITLKDDTQRWVKLNMLI